MDPKCIRTVSLGGTYVFPPCAHELIPCRQSCFVQKSVCKDKFLKEVACHIVVEPRVPDRSLDEPGCQPIK